MKYSEFIKIKEFNDFKQFNQIRKSYISDFGEILDKANGKDNHWHYTENFVINDISPDSRFRYAIIEMEDGDRVYVHFKIIQIMKTKQIRLVNAPISLNDNDVNVAKIVGHFKTLPYVKGTIKVKDLKYFEDWSIEKRKEETEHYSFLEDWKLKCNNNKWITKRRIKWTLQDDNFKFMEATSSNIESMTRFFDSWAEYKANKKETVSAKKMYYRMINAVGERDDIKIYIMTYKGEIVSMVGYTTHKNTANQIINMSAPRTTIEYDSEKARKIFFDLTHQMTWFTYLELDKNGIEYIYCGDGTDSKGMEIYKTQCNTSVLEYVKITPFK